MKLMRYLTLSDHASGFSDDEILTNMLNIFGWHTMVYNEVDRILKLTPEEAILEIRESKPETDYERQFIEELLKSLDDQKQMRVKRPGN